MPRWPRAAACSQAARTSVALLRKNRSESEPRSLVVSTPATRAPARRCAMVWSAQAGIGFHPGVAGGPPVGGVGEVDDRDRVPTPSTHLAVDEPEPRETVRVAAVGAGQHGLGEDAGFGGRDQRRPG